MVLELGVLREMVAAKSKLCRTAAWQCGGYLLGFSGWSSMLVLESDIVFWPMLAFLFFFLLKYSILEDLNTNDS